MAEESPRPPFRADHVGSLLHFLRGFSSTHHGNKVTVDGQRRKLALALEVAREVWGG